eukprot:CAMPEP_0206531832 /NCGR_PEP_ID=MMETSP0325_2-20121206/3995_1 /ASSEMBLY_ACC=CAM_ASM_000347 /TAXON_ID=2866 /ORGANISM="Crypthecodinium cohnii, Strain Seligo" /LENGTH=635 /DNA_ID=CAMNT_0054028141 /DNA_START=33 /DNA_END=1941 /DNA_ORIENTATION=-
MSQPRVWKIVGGGDKGGIVVREGQQLASPALDERLATDSEIEEIKLVGDRLQFRRLNGSGPNEGWISTKITGKALAELVPPKVSAPTSAAGTVSAGIGGDANEEPAWIEESRQKLKMFREGTPVLAPKNTAVRLRTAGLNAILPSFKRLAMAEMKEACKKNLPGHISGLKFPHDAEQLKSFGPEWYTEAFRKFGTLAKDNRVTRVVEVKQLPHSGFDCAGGAGHKAFVTLEFEKPDPNLHTELFAKFPWDFFASPMEEAMRMQMSCYADLDAPELLTYLCCEELFPFRIPKLYFCDINRDTTNFILLLEKIPFGQRGAVKDGRTVERLERRPFELLPVCGKYQDYLLDDPAQIYYCIFREMAHLAAWDHQGRYDAFLQPAVPYTAEQGLQYAPKKPAKMKMKELKQQAVSALISKGEEFATKIAPQIFTAAGKDPAMLKRMKEDLAFMAPHFDDMKAFAGSTSDWLGASHMNLQADNAYFWRDEHGDLDCGIFDWCGFSRCPFVTTFLGCLAGAEADILDAHEEGLMKTFCDEYARYGGPKLDYKEMLLKYRLLWPGYLVDCCQWIERDIYRDWPQEKWPLIKDKYDEKFVGNWHVRCRASALITAFEFWPKRNFRKVMEDWCVEYKQYLTPYVP